MVKWTVVGVDPAPSKKTVLWTERGAVTVSATEVGAALRREASGDAVLLAWDAPLSFDAKFGFSDRPIDWCIRRLIREHPIEPKAVAALPFAGCSHWAITCSTLGTPFSNGTAPWSLGAGLPAQEGKYVFEVNPSVAWAFWWIKAGIDVPMPRYKGQDSKHGRDALVAKLGELSIPVEAAQNDDALDAWAAWRLLHDLVRGEAEVVGAVAEGSYLLPKIPKLGARITALLHEARAKLGRV